LSANWHAQPAPDDLHALVNRFFHRGPTADIGCGGGREVPGSRPTGLRPSAVTRPRACWRGREHAIPDFPAQGRLYSAFGAVLVTDALAGAAILFDEDAVSASSGQTIHRVIARKEAGATAKR
jgi:hypothetical protein